MKEKYFSLINKSRSTFLTQKISFKFIDYLIEKKDTKYKKNIVLIEGIMGSGKTIFVKGIAKKLGIKNIVNSPTFLLLKSYQGIQNKIHHLDLYRILNYKKSSIINIIEEILENVEIGDILIIETIKNILSFFPYWDFQIKIDVLDLKNRKIFIKENKKNNSLKKDLFYI
jgi:tRNA threonylcarbamoyladenosine biosynthesis protein TsaE